MIYIVIVATAILNFLLSDRLMAEENRLDQGPIGLELQITIDESAQILLAQNERQGQQVRRQQQQQQQPARGGSRQKHLTGEARTSSAKTNIDFDAAAIDGERRAPVGVAIGSNKPDNEYDLINLRLRWHPEMIKSTSNLETGRGQ